MGRPLGKTESRHHRRGRLRADQRMVRGAIRRGAELTPWSDLRLQLSHARRHGHAVATASTHANTWGWCEAALRALPNIAQHSKHVIRSNRMRIHGWEYCCR